MAFENAGRCCPKTMILTPVMMLRSAYEFCIKPHVVAQNMRVSLINGTIAAAETYDSKREFMQYLVVPILEPDTPCVAVRQPPTTASHEMKKKAVMYTLRSYIALTLKKKRREVVGIAMGNIA